MRSPKLPAPLKALILSCTVISLGACASISPQVVTLPVLDCGALIPPSFRQPIQAPPIPGDTVGAIASALDAAVSRLDLANQREADTIAIADACRAEQAKVVAALAPSHPWWKFWSKS